MDIELFKSLADENPFMSIKDITYKVILHEIILFKIPANTRLSEVTIAEELGISRSPVKTAMDMLEEEGYIYTKSSRRYVSAFSKKEYLELFDISMMVEPYAAAEAAVRINKEKLDELYHIAEDINKIYEGFNDENRSAISFEKALDGEERFHSAIVDAAGNRLLSELYSSVKDRIFRYRGFLLYKRLDNSLKGIDADHVFICDALRFHDRDMAAAAAKRHLMVAYNGVINNNLFE